MRHRSSPRSAVPEPRHRRGDLLEEPPPTTGRPTAVRPPRTAGRRRRRSGPPRRRHGRGRGPGSPVPSSAATPRPERPERSPLITVQPGLHGPQVLPGTPLADHRRVARVALRRPGERLHRLLGAADAAGHRGRLHRRSLSLAAADTTMADPLTPFIGLCLAADNASVHDALGAHNHLLERAKAERTDLVARAVEWATPMLPPSSTRRLTERSWATSRTELNCLADRSMPPPRNPPSTWDGIGTSEATTSVPRRAPMTDRAYPRSLRWGDPRGG